MIGIDTQETADVADSLVTHGAAYLRRVFTPAEADATLTMSAERRVAYLAGRFAAKEAVLKALRPPYDLPVPWPSVEIVRGPNGPEARLHGHIADYAAAQGIASVTVSITHTPTAATAVALAGRAS